MKTSLRVLYATLALLIMAGLVSCGFSGGAKYEIALITDVGDIDDNGCNQSAWSGVKRYAGEHGISYKYYRPAQKDTQAFMNAIADAVSRGAGVIVCPGAVFEDAVRQAQTQYENIRFILIDSSLEDVGPNTCAIGYSELEAGFLAGYAAVKDGFRNLAFQGERKDAETNRFGFGFIQGAEYAAREMNLDAFSVEIQYNYSTPDSSSAEVQARAELWYSSGTEVIFACGTTMCSSVIAIAEASDNRWVMGSDFDGSKISETVISSALKCVGTSVYNALSSYYSGSFPGGEHLLLGAAQNGVGLEMENARWKSFSASDYDSIMKILIEDADAVRSSLITYDDGERPDIDSSSDFMALFNTQHVLIKYVS